MSFPVPTCSLYRRPAKALATAVAVLCMMSGAYYAPAFAAPASVAGHATATDIEAMQQHMAMQQQALDAMRQRLNALEPAAGTLYDVESQDALLPANPLLENKLQYLKR